MEWWRGWFLSGFSWLSLGYSQTDTWLAGFAPLVGVYGLSALLLVCAGALVTLLLGTHSQRRIAVVVLALPWLAGAALYGHLWTQPAGPRCRWRWCRAPSRRTRSGSRATATTR